MSMYVPGMGPRGAKIMIVGECPAINELKEGKPFIGPQGKELDRLLSEAGINRSDCWVTNLCKYFVPPNIGKKKIPFGIRAANAGIDMPAQIENLQKEINEIKPNVILALGGTALYYITGQSPIGDYRGSILLGMGRKVIGTYNPAHLLHMASGVEFKGYWNRQIMIFDMKRALKQSAYSGIIRPERHVEICRNSAHLEEFFRQYEGRIPSVDIESGGHCLPVCIGFAFNKRHGMCVPLWNVDGISTIPDSDLVQCWQMMSDKLWQVMGVIGQNFNYDRDKIKRLGFRVRRVLEDTMFKAFAINPELPKGLAFNTSIYTEEPFYKNEGMYKGSYEDLFLGCARDACVTHEVCSAMDADLDEVGQRIYYQNYLMRLSPMYWEIEQCGFGIDPIAQRRLLEKYIAWDERIRYRLFQLTGDLINVNSTKQIPILLWDILKLPRKGSTGEEAITELLNSPIVQSKSEDVKEILELILEDRRVRRTISAYLMALPDYDGRLRTTYFPCLETGRSSTGLLEVSRPTIELKDFDGKKKKRHIGMAFQTMTKHGDVGSDVREMMIP